MAGRREVWVRIGFVVALVLTATGMRALRVRSMDHFIETQTYEDIYYLPPPDWLRIFSLGHREALADLIFMKGLIYFGEEFSERGAVEHVFDYADAALALDPNFKRLYRWVGMAGMYRPVAPTAEDFRRSTEYLRVAARLFPDDGELAWDAGSTILYELRPYIEDEEEKAQMEIEALELMQRAARLGAGPSWLGMANATALRRLGRIDQAIRQLEEVYLTVNDPDEKRRIEARIRMLSGESYASALTEELNSLSASHVEEFPYVPFEFYLLLGPRPPVDEAEQLLAGFVPITHDVVMPEIETPSVD